jgi:tetratricopeptide (TPR) repeat protein
MCLGIIRRFALVTMAAMTLATPLHAQLSNDAWNAKLAEAQEQVKQGNLETAEKLALELADQSPVENLPHFVHSRNYLAHLYLHAGRLERAEWVYGQVFDLIESKPELVNQQSLDFLSKAADTLASKYQSEGNYDKAIEYHQLNYEFGVKVLGPTHLSLSQSLNNIGSAYEWMYESDKAEEFYEKALAIAADPSNKGETGVNLAEASVLLNLSGAATKKGRIERALELLGRAEKLVMSDTTGDVGFRHWVRMMVGNAYQALHKKGKARDIYTALKKELQETGESEELLPQLDALLATLEPAIKTTATPGS